MLLPVLPAYAGELGFNEYQIGLLLGVFMFGRVIFQFPLGMLSDHIGRKAVMAGALLLFAVTTLGYALTTDATTMIVFRFFQGISSGGFFISYESYLNDRTPRELRGLANGINSGAVNAGVILGPIIGGFLSQAINIQAPFYVGALLGFLCFILILVIPHVKAHKVIRSWSELLPTPTKLKSIFTPILSAPVASLSLVHFLQLVGMTLFLMATPMVMAELFSWTSADIALALAISGLAAVLFSPFAGRLSDRPGWRLSVMAAGLAALSIQCLLIYIHAGVDTATASLAVYGTGLIIAGLIIGGVGTPAYYSSFFSVIGDVTLIRHRGGVGGFIGSFGEMGSVIAASIIGPYLWQTYSVQSPIGAAFILLVAATLIVVAVRPLLYRQVRKIEALPES